MDRRTGLRERARRLAENRWFQNTVMGAILVNAVTLGLETSGSVMAVAGEAILALDRLLITLFVVELAIRIVAYGTRFFRDPWSVFDFVVVAIALAPGTGSLSVLRSLRVLRVLRLITAVPRLRLVVGALLGAIPGIGAIIGLMALLFYVASVMATKLFGAGFPEWFGTIGASLYSLFQIMTLESWSMGIVRPVMEQYPFAWAFFVPFILIATFTMLNLFIGVVVSAIQSQHDAAVADLPKPEDELRREIGELRQELRELRGLLAASSRSDGQPPP